MKNNHLILIISFLLILFSVDGFGQRWKLRRYEVGFGVGSTHSHVDIGPQNKEINNFFNGARPNVSLDVRFKISPSFAVNLDLGYLNMAGKDIDEPTRGRNYSFVSHNFEHTVRGEYYILGEGRAFGSQANYNRRGMVNNYNKVYLYVFTGFGGIMSKGSVKDMDNGDLPPDGNPGYDNNMHYGLVIPVGAGLKYTISAVWSLNLEAGYRWSSSDYLDSYASAFSKYNDNYYTTSFKALYKIRNNRKGRPIFRKYAR